MKRNIESIVGATVVSVRYYRALSETDTVIIELSNGVRLTCNQMMVDKIGYNDERALS
jgi:hypothetical protein